MSTYYARLCWNTNGWLRPDPAAKNEGKNTFSSASGFGHEEWLFDFARRLPTETGKYHYAFLQPVNRSRKRFAGRIIDVLLYSIDSDKQRVYVGKIHNCKVLTDVERRMAYDEYSRLGWISDMKTEIEVAGGDPTLLDAAEFNPFNVRLIPHDAKIFDPPYPVALPDDRVKQLNRYWLISLDSAAEKQWNAKGTQLPLNTQKYRTPGGEGSIIDPTHKKLQNELFVLLQKRYGVGSVSMEANYVDIKVNTPDRTILIELKTAPKACVAIREALGQILEYAYFASHRNREKIDLVICAPGCVTPDVAEYINLLRNGFKLPIQYCTVFLGMTTLPQALT